MTKIITVHSLQSGTGKSHITANIATLLAAAGYHVAIIDGDITTPSIYRIFGIDPTTIRASLNDFLWGKCAIEDTCFDISDRLERKIKGQLWLVPFVSTAHEINYDISLLSDSFEGLSTTLELDFLLIDTSHGVHETTLPSIAFSDTEVLILRPDDQDFQDTSVAIDIGQHLGIPDMLLIVNQVPDHLNHELVRNQVQAVYHCDVIAVLPYADELANLAAGQVFVLHQPQHPITEELTRAAAILSV